MRNESRNQQTYDKSYQEAPVELESRWTASFAQVCAIPTCHLVLYSSGTRIVPTNRGSRGIRRTRHRARRTSRRTTRRYAFDTLQFTEFRTSLCVSQLAASFTATRAKTSTAVSGRIKKRPDRKPHEAALPRVWGQSPRRRSTNGIDV